VTGKTSIQPVRAQEGLRRPFRNHPALTAWWAELAAGKRDKLTFDPLWRAACEEMTALEFDVAGLLEIAESRRREAERIIRNAARGACA
jgi:hypothetical protein